MRCWRGQLYTNARKGSRDEGGALKPRFMLLKSFSQGWMCPEKASLSLYRGLTFQKAFVCLARVKGASHCAWETLY